MQNCKKKKKFSSSTQFFNKRGTVPDKFGNNLGLTLAQIVDYVVEININVVTC